MSYIIAFVTFSKVGTEYPVECFRTDVVPEDEVYIRRSDGQLRLAVVAAVKFLNWDCQARIVCKSSEASFMPDGSFRLNPGVPEKLGLLTKESLISILRDRGWTPLKHSTMTYRMVLMGTNDFDTARIWVRRNGVDLQLLPSVVEPLPRPFSALSGQVGVGRFVRHHLAHSEVNLFEFVLLFAEAFEQERGDYDRFFVEVGQRDKRTDELREESARRNETRRLQGSKDAGGSMEDVYDAASSGDGSDAYLSDGVWITAGGRVYSDD